MKSKTSFFGDISAPSDSEDYAVALRDRAQGCLASHHTDVTSLEIWLALLRDKDRFKNLRRKNGSPFPSWRDFCEAKPQHGLGYSATALEMMIREGKTPESRAEKPMPLLEPHRPTKDEDGNPNNVRVNGHGNSADYLTARIARDHPAILDRMKAGEFRSVRAAAIEAGIVKPDTPLTLLMRAWNRASTEERTKFQAWTEEPK